MIMQNNAQKSQDSHSFRIDKDSINFKQEYTYLDVFYYGIRKITLAQS